jgi:hypothetical protein
MTSRTDRKTPPGNQRNRSTQCNRVGFAIKLDVDCTEADEIRELIDIISPDALRINGTITTKGRCTYSANFQANANASNRKVANQKGANEGG